MTAFRSVQRSRWRCATPRRPVALTRACRSRRRIPLVLADLPASSLASYFALLLPALLTLLSCLPAHAGHYEVVYSGGQVAPGPKGKTSIPYYKVGEDNKGWGGATGYGGSVPCSATGQITTTLTWTGDNPDDAEPAPDCVIVREKCDLEASSSGYGGIDYDDGFGNPDSFNLLISNGQSNWTGHLKHTGYRYTIRGGSPITLYESPGANAASGTQPDGSPAPAT